MVATGFFLGGKDVVSSQARECVDDDLMSLQLIADAMNDAWYRGEEEVKGSLFSILKAAEGVRSRSVASNPSYAVRLQNGGIDTYTVYTDQNGIANAKPSNTAPEQFGPYEQLTEQYLESMPRGPLKLTIFGVYENNKENPPFIAKREHSYEATEQAAPMSGLRAVWVEWTSGNRGIEMTEEEKTLVNSGNELTTKQVSDLRNRFYLDGGKVWKVGFTT